MARPLFQDTPASLRRLVLLLYALVLPCFLGVLAVTSAPAWRAPALAAVCALCAAGAGLLAAHPAPRPVDWVYPVAVAPTLCCGLAYLATGGRIPAYLGVMGAPLAWSAVLFERPSVLAAWVTGVLACLGAVGLVHGPAAAAAGALVYGTVQGLVGWVVYGKSWRRRAQARLVAHEHVLEHLQDAVLLFDRDGVITDYLGASEAVYGWTRAEALGRRLDVDLRAEFPDGDGEAFRAALQAGRPARAHLRALRKDGAWIDLDVLADARRDPAGAVVGYSSVARDVGPQLRTARALREALAENQRLLDEQRAAAEEQRQAAADRLHTLMATSIDAVLLVDADGRILEANDVAAVTYGYAQEELRRLNVRQLRAPESVQAVEAQLQRASARGAVRFEAVHVRKDGSPFPVEVSARAFEAGGRRLMQSFVRDLSARQAYEQRLKLALEGSGAGLWEAWPAAGRVFVSRGWAERLGMPSETWDLAQPALHDLFLPDDPEARDRIRAHVAGETPAYEYERRLTAAGAPCWVNVRGKVVERDAAGDPVRFAGSLVDVSGRKALELQLVQADRLAALGTLVAGIAHEVNNPLAYVTANVAFALDRLQGAPGAEPAERRGEVVRALRQAADGAERVRRIVSDLRAFSRAEAQAPEVFDPREALQAALHLTAASLHRRGRVEVSVRPLPAVEGDPHRLAQALVNLMVNAAQALPDERPEENLVRVATETDAAGRAVLVVADNGRGMSPEVQARIFDPFFTTKPVGAGTGLGLAITYGIVAGMGGEIGVESAPGAGTTFRLVLPAARRAPAPPRPATPAPGPARLLVLDLDPRVAGALARVLAPPYEVRVAGDVAEAGALLGAAPGFDAVLADTALPPAALAALAAAVAAAGLGERTLLLSTSGAGGARAWPAPVPPGRVLAKPFDPETVRASVRAVLAPSP